MNNTMEDKSFATSITVDAPAEQVFNAVTNVRGWWSEEIEGDTNKEGSEFIYHYKDVHQCRIILTEVIPGKKVVWLVKDNFFKFTQDKREWVNTKIIFDIIQHGDKTELRFTHEGLVPAYECYEICEEAWTNYISNSLRDLIVTGKGQPNPKEGGYNEQLAEKWKL